MDEHALTAFVFAGGGSLGAVQVGMLHALVEDGQRPDFVVGASVGALNAAYFAGAPDLAGVERLAGIWRGLRRADIFPLSPAAMMRFFFHTGSLVDPGNLRKLVQANLGFALLEDAALPLHVMATDQQGVGVRLSTGPAVDAIMASAAVPGIFPAVPIGGRPLMDGAIAANTPLRLAAQLGARRIIVLPTGYACALEGPPESVIGRMLHAVTLLIAWQLMHEIEAMPEGVRVHLAPALCPQVVSPYDFSNTDALITRARRLTRIWIRRGGLDRPARGHELSPHHH